MVAWKDTCKAAGVGDTILTPYIDAELLAHNQTCALTVHGHEIEATGFAYNKCPHAPADRGNSERAEGHNIYILHSACFRR